MHTYQQTIIAELGVQPLIDAAVACEERIQFICDYVQSSGFARHLVIGVSGGQDSTLAGRLCQLAAERLRAAGYPCTCIAVRLPYQVQFDEEDARRAISFIAPDRVVTFNIHGITSALSEEFTRATGDELADFHRGNVKARARMVAQYAIAGQVNGLVVGTDHAAEAVTGFYTKFGDGGADMVPLAGLTKTQGRQLLRTLGAPESLIVKEPTADLLDGDPGQSDEANLGVSYAEIDAYLTGQRIDDAAAKRIESLYLRSAHKRHMPAGPSDSWWRRNETN